VTVGTQVVTAMTETLEAAGAVLEGAGMTGTLLALLLLWAE
jgi:hypothetical protein